MANPANDQIPAANDKDGSTGGGDKADPHKTEKLTQHGHEAAEKANGEEAAEGGN